MTVLLFTYRRPITAILAGREKTKEKKQYMAQKNGMRRYPRPML